MNIKNQDQIMKNWSALLDASDDIQNDMVRVSTAIVLENAQNEIDSQYKRNNQRGLLLEHSGPAGMGTLHAMGPVDPGQSYANTMGDARIPSVVIPMIRRIFPQLLAHKLVGVQPMQGPIGMAFAYRARYGRFGRGGNMEGHEIGYLNVNAAHTGKPQVENKFNNEPYPVGEGSIAGAQDQGALDGNPDASGLVSGKFGMSMGNRLGANPVDPDAQDTRNGMLKYFFGEGAVSRYGADTYGMIGDGADTSDAENWAVGRDMPEASFEFMKATVTAKSRKLGVQITREAEEDMRVMQGVNAQQEVANILSYEIAQEIDRQLIGEMIQAAIRAHNTTIWNPAQADGRNQNERVNALYTTILAKSTEIAVKSRRGAANWCVASPQVTALLEAQISNPLSVGGGLSTSATAFGKTIDDGVGVAEVGTLRNGSIKLYRDVLAGGDYALLGFKGRNIYDSGIFYMPYIPLELMTALDPFTFNPVTAARTRYGVTTNLFGAGQFYQFIGFEGLNSTLAADASKVFIQ